MLNLTFRPHRSSLLAGSAEPQKLFAMLKLIPQGEAAHARPALALALVIDTSSSMREFADQQQALAAIENQGLQGQQQSAGDGAFRGYSLAHPTKLDQAVEAAHALIDDARLTPDDRVALIQFDDDARPLLPLTRLTNKPAAHQAVEGLRACSGATRLAQGLRCAAEALADLPLAVAQRILLLTDGQTTDEPECRTLVEGLRYSDAPIVAIGTGVEYNEQLLRELADGTRGRPYHLRQMADLRAILEAEVGSAAREAVIGLQARVAAVKNVALDSFTRVYPSLADVDTAEAPCRLGNIAAGDYTVFILEFTVSGVARPPSRARLAQVTLDGQVPGQLALEVPPQDLFVTFTTDRDAVAAVDPEVLGYVQQKNVDRMLQDAVRQSTIDAGRARRTLQMAAGMTRRLGGLAMTQVIENALDELDRTGGMSPGTCKTLGLGARTRTVKTGAAPLEGVPSEAEIRRLTGT